MGGVGELHQRLVMRVGLELASAWQTAWDTGPRWREKLEAGRERLPEAARLALRDALERARLSRERRRLL